MSTLPATAELIEMATDLHLIFVLTTIFVAVVSFFFIFSDKDFRAFSKWVESIALQYYFMLGSLFFTGLILWTTESFVLHWKIFMMVGAMVVILFTSIRLHRIYKKTRLNDIPSQLAFKSYAKRKYLADIALLVGTAAIAYAVPL